ncbi:MAG: DUF6607 family protein [Bacteriovoracaceae bacterium]
MKAFIALLVTSFLMSSAYADASNMQGHNTLNKQQDVSWVFTRKLPKGTRGGSTTGTPVIFDNSIPKVWKDLKDTQITNYERDRRAILAMAGEFEVKFEFIETFLMETNKDLDTPYASWGTEYVKVIEDRGDFISLQHIMVIFFKDPKTGDIKGPMVVKHWRQDWQWEGTEILEFQGKRHWKVKTLNANEMKGKWVWNVYQVDDSPRYSGTGSWNHFKSASVFDSGYLSRPLPRREFSVRGDYDILMGKDNLIVTPTAWFHEQKAFKHETSLKGQMELGSGSFLSREVGHNSYKRIKNFDFSAGHKYWSQTEGYWADVRTVWNEILSTKAEYKLKGKVYGKSLWATHFAQAADKNVLGMPKALRQELIRQTLLSFMY